MVVTTYTKPHTHILYADLNTLFNYNIPTYILADFNATHTAFHHTVNNPRGTQLLRISTQKHLRFLGPDFPTSFNHNGRGRPDLIFTNRQSLFLHHHISPGPVCGSDHIPVILHISSNPISIPSPPRHNYSKIDWDNFTTTIEETDLRYNFEGKTPETLDQQAERIQDTILDAANTHSPTVHHNTYRDFKPSHRTLRLITCYRHRYTHNQLRVQRVLLDLNILRRHILARLQEDHNEHWHNLIQRTELHRITTPSKFWARMRSLKGCQGCVLGSARGQDVVLSRRRRWRISKRVTLPGLLGTGTSKQRALSGRTRTLLGRDEDRYVRSLAEDVEGHLNANDRRPAYQALKKLCSKSPSRTSAIRAADGCLVSNMDGQMARWNEFSEQLFTVDPPIGQFHTTGLRAVDANPPIDETAASFDEVREAVAKLSGSKAAGVCKISAELLKAWGAAMIRWLHAVLTAVWQSGTILPDWKSGLVVPICHLLKHQRPQQSGFTPGKSTTDRFLVLRVLVERRREFRQGMLAAYVHLKKAFDSVHLIFAESLEILVMVLKALHEEAKPLGLEVSWLKTKVQVFGGYLDEAVQFVYACGEDIEILESFTYLNSRITPHPLAYLVSCSASASVATTPWPSDAALGGRHAVGAYLVDSGAEVSVVPPSADAYTCLTHNPFPHPQSSSSTGPNTFPHLQSSSYT
ncbi:hypothetical protein GWK47_010475 [Chionoecetes opilio]|uniref:Endonuclease/exonuclease/phosphatase domain-containing protein n=1 Tax=Chionoecetes opilio TaxID=41210 RepID=A0A8J5CP34_CHIOP|nr:hypothetical protein GWK47_010475 [Chionoecetes opilio]